MNMNPQEILDAHKPLNVELFDQVVASFYSGNSSRQIHDILAQFEQSPTAWTKAPDIIQKSAAIESKMIALAILEKCIKTRWQILPTQSKKGIKGFVESLVVKLSQDPNVKQLGPFLTKLNTVLIEIIKREWPHNWPGFITQVVEVSKRSEVVCANNMNLLRLLSEEAFENPSLHLSHAQIDSFQGNLTKELSKVFELCMFVLKNSSNQRLIECTLKTLHKFLAIKWIPIAIVFSSQLIEALTLKYFGMQQYRVLTLECLVEIAGIRKQAMASGGGCANDKLVNMFLTVLRKTLSECGLSMQTDLGAFARASQHNLKLVQTLTNFLFNLLRFHHQLLEAHNNGSREGLKAALQLFLQITRVENQTLFQISCDLWEFVVRDLQKSLPRKNVLNLAHGQSQSQGQYDLDNARYALYRDALHDLKTVMMRRLPRPKEVLVVKDENNNVIKQEMKDTFQLTLHKQMSKCLYMLSAIDPADTRTVIGEKLTAFSSHQQQRKSKGSSHNEEEENQFFAELNSLCWSIGAVAGSMPPDVEKSFLVVVIKILLSLCEVQQSKNAKAMIASCIMYVVRKYPRFLKKHWKFLQTVVRKLIEFLAERHPGVQDMSIETLNEIGAKCGHKFLKVQENDARIFLDELVQGMQAMTAKLDREQVENLYATWSVVISHERNDHAKAARHVQQLLVGVNARYQALFADAAAFARADTIRHFIHLLRVYRQVGLHCGGASNGAFLPTFSNIYKSLMALYSGYAQLMHSYYSAPQNSAVPRSAAPDEIKLMSTLKAEILQLFETLVTKGSCKGEHEQIASQLVPAFLDAVLTDYSNCSDVFREASCLNVCSALIERLDDKMAEFIPKMFGTLFQITLDMIKDSMENHPDHRLAFFKFLHSVVRHNFAVFERMNSAQMQLVINCIMWAHEHIDHAICELGIRTLGQFLRHIRGLTARTQSGALMTMFYRNFLLLILEKLLHVMTDTLHKASFAPMSRALKGICHDINTQQLLGPLWSAEQPAQSNQEFVAMKLSAFIQNKFQHLTAEVTHQFVLGLFELANAPDVASQANGKGPGSPGGMGSPGKEGKKDAHSDPYVQHCEDFLVAIRSVHKGADNGGAQQGQGQQQGQQQGGAVVEKSTHSQNGAAVDFNDDDL